VRRVTSSQEIPYHFVFLPDRHFGAGASRSNWLKAKTHTGGTRNATTRGVIDVITSIDQSSFSTWIRESPSIFAYPIIIFLHTVGLGLLVGTSAVIDLRVLGAGRRDLALAPLNRLFPLFYFGFWISAASGILLWMADAHVWLVDVVFYIKLGLIVLGMLSVRVVRNRVLRHPLAAKNVVAPSGRLIAAASLVLWAAAITAGRLTAYIGK
jgi:hypothetical protein